MSEWQVERISDTDYVYKVDGVVMGHETTFARAVAKLELQQRIDRRESSCISTK